MPLGKRSALALALILAAQAGFAAISAGPAVASSDVGFGKSLLTGEGSDFPTTLQFGPDGRLYVGQFDGTINAYTISRDGRNDYTVTATETIDRVARILNHDDDGTPRPDVEGRLVTGLLVVGTAANPTLYVSSSDPRLGGIELGDVGLDTNSGVVSRLRWTGTKWVRRDLVRGLPRSEEVHLPNGLALDPATKTLYLAVGGNTNMGAASAAFAELPEYALSAAILSIDLENLGSTPYDIPTLDDLTRSGNPDPNDPFGGNDGLNQAKIVPGGPVQVFSPGYRNPYDLMIADNGNLYGTDNGSNAGAGGLPVGEGTSACTNEAQEGGSTNADSLHLIFEGHYGGHPNPTRASTANTFGGQSPVPAGDPAQCAWLTPGPARGSIATFPESTNGIAQYRATNFSGAMTGDLLLASLRDELIVRVELNGTGDAVVSTTTLFSSVGRRPLDLTTQGDDDAFPGTIWVVNHAASTIVVFEPNDYDGTPGPCTDIYDILLDDDADGFSNADEVDNGTDPCSAGDIPADADGDRISDLNDPDDDNDSLADTSDRFALDPTNGAAESLPVRLTWDPGSGQQGGVADTGFTGLMTNGVSDYSTLFDPSKMTVGSATGTLTIDEVSDGTAHGAVNTQRFGFQLGMDADPATTGSFLLRTRILAPFAGMVPQAGQSMGVMLGTGEQDHYVELSTSGSGEVSFRLENGGVTSVVSVPLALPGPDSVELTLKVDPSAGSIVARYAAESGGVVGPTIRVAGPVSVPKRWFSSKPIAMGLISTSDGTGTPFPATWDYLRATPLGLQPVAAPAVQGPAAALGTWVSGAPTGLVRQEASFTRIGNRFFLAWGGTAHQVYNPRRDRWRSVADTPEALNHIQTVALNGLIYSIGGSKMVPGQPKPSAGTVWIYDPSTDTFSSGTPMPVGRERGAGAVAVWHGDIYYFGGLHDGVSEPWVDVYDPAADSWSSLPDMPRARDHFQSAVVGDTMYAIGGRQGDPLTPFGFNDAFDFATGTWTTGLAELPTPRGGYAAAVVQGQVLVIGGEAGGQALADVEAYDPLSDTWTTLADMPTGRKGIQAVVWHGRIFVATGGAGGAPTDVNEIFTPPDL